MNPFRLSSRVRPPPRVARPGATHSAMISASIGAAVRERAGLAPPRTGDAVGSQETGGSGEENDAVEDRGAVEVPWRVTARSASGVIEVHHGGLRPAHSVRFALAGAGVLGLSLPGTVLPGERVRVVVRGGAAEGCAAAADAMLVLRWFEPDGREFLWPIALD